MEKGGEWGKPRPLGSTRFDEPSVIPDWPSLPPELVQGIANCVLSTTGGVDAYMDMRAVCPSWRSAIAKPSPLDAVADLRFRPRHWVMVDLKSDSDDDDARLFLHGPTGRFRQLRLPVLRHHILVDASDGLLVLADREPPHSARVLNPFTGDIIHFAAQLPASFMDTNTTWHTAVSGGSHFRLFLWRRGTLFSAAQSSDIFTEKVYLTPRTIVSGTENPQNLKPAYFIPQTNEYQTVNPLDPIRADLDTGFAVVDLGLVEQGLQRLVYELWNGHVDSFDGFANIEGSL